MGHHLWVKGKIYMEDVPHLFDKKCNFIAYFLLSCASIQFKKKKRSFLKGKNLLPLEANSFILE